MTATPKTTPAAEFERQHGSVRLVKVAFSALTALLVKKGVCTEAELCKAFEAEVKKLAKKS